MTENNEGLEKASQGDLSRNLKDKGSAKQAGRNLPAEEIACLLAWW